MRPIGIFLIIAALLVPLYWYVGWIAGPDGSAMFSQYIGSVSIIAMGISMMLSTRIMGLEPVFGGLDRIYVIHKWLGILAVVTILIHDTVDAELQGRETFLTDLGETLGEVSLYGILILVVITIVTFIPYHLWLWTHKFMGLFFTFSAVHYILLMKPLDPITPLGIYMLVFCVLGIISYIYTLLPLRGGRDYHVSGIQTSGSMMSLELKPVSRGISHRAGQFAFLDIKGAKKSEVHPFTISKAPDGEGTLRFTIKALGDFTHDIAKSVKVGQKASVSRAYGHFRRKNRAPEIWVAGGIGITPF
ncbi:MAG: ferric reductase-like transmembrane domain-containing protein, partial [Lentilitoribacter sp.]